MDRQRFLLPALALITVWRLALLPTLELSPDEALAALFARHPHAWYLEMGPLTPWLVRLTTGMFGATELGVRLLAPLFAFAASVCLWRLSRGVFDAAVAAWAVVLLQVLPVFNVCAVTMTSATPGLAALVGLALALRIALHRPSPWHAAWWLAALCLLLAMLADWRNGLAYICCALALGLPRRRRHHLLSPGFGLLTLVFVVVAAWFLSWNADNDWPVLETGQAEPVWTVAPNALRWMVLASPLLLTLMIWSLDRTCRAQSRMPDVFLLLAFLVPFALVDFAWGPVERWPHAGFAVWMVLCLPLLAFHSLQSLWGSTRRKVLLRTTAAITGALLSMLLMRTDMLRWAGVLWPMQQRAPGRHAWPQCFRADPSSDMQSWRETARLVAGVASAVSQQNGRACFMIANDWRLGVPLDFYLPASLPVLQPGPEQPRVQVIQQVERNNPLALWPRYDSQSGGKSAFEGRDALFVTDDALRGSPPAEIRSSFASWQLLSVARIKHCGQQVRTVKIFACQGYKSPDL